METSASIGLAFLAGVLTVSSPCILPLLPAVLGLTAAQSRGRAFLVAVGLAVGFTVLGVSISLFGTVLGQDSNTVRIGGAVLLIAFGLLLLVPSWQHRLLGRMHVGLPGAAGNSAWSALLTGVLLGFTWIPCAGPVLGSVSALVFSQADVGLGAAMFFAFGLGTGVPLVAVAYAGKHFLLRALMRRQAQITRFAGGLVLLAGVLVLTGLDRELQNTILQYYSGWLI